MVTATDDINARLSALETGISEIRSDIRALNTRQDRYQAEQNDRFDRYQAEINERFERHQAETTTRQDKFQSEVTARLDKIQAENARHQSEITARLDKFQSEVTERIDRVSARIDRYFWAVIGLTIGIIAIGAGIIGTMITAVFRLT